MQSEIVELREALSDLREEVSVLQEEVARFEEVGVSRGANSSGERQCCELTGSAYYFGSFCFNHSRGQPCHVDLRGVLTRLVRFSPGLNERLLLVKLVAFLAKSSQRGSSWQFWQGSETIWLRDSGLFAVALTGRLTIPQRSSALGVRACALVKRGSAVGDSVFVGLPSQAECSVAISAAGLSYVGQIDD